MMPPLGIKRILIRFMSSRLRPGWTIPHHCIQRRYRTGRSVRHRSVLEQVRLGNPSSVLAVDWRSRSLTTMTRARCCLKLPRHSLAFRRGRILFTARWHPRPKLEWVLGISIWYRKSLCDRSRGYSDLRRLCVIRVRPWLHRRSRVRRSACWSGNLAIWRKRKHWCHGHWQASIGEVPGMALQSTRQAIRTSADVISRVEVDLSTLGSTNISNLRLAPKSAPVLFYQHRRKVHRKLFLRVCRAPTVDPVGGFEVGQFISTPNGLLPFPRVGRGE